MKGVVHHLGCSCDQCFFIGRFGSPERVLWDCFGVGREQYIAGGWEHFIVTGLRAGGVAGDECDGEFAVCVSEQCNLRGGDGESVAESAGKWSAYRNGKSAGAADHFRTGAGGKRNGDDARGEHGFDGDSEPDGRVAGGWGPGLKL